LPHAVRRTPVSSIQRRGEAGVSVGTRSRARSFERQAVSYGGIDFYCLHQTEFSRLKASLAFVVRKGLHIMVAKPHFHRYLTEWDFKWNTRKIKHGERATAAQGHWG
jgi:hypothetical protein